MTSGTGDQRTEPTAERTDGDGDAARQDRGQLWLAALVVLAILASVIMLLTDSATALKFALIAALWAAVIGFILVGRYRNQARSAKDELVLREQTMQAELEKAKYEAEAAAAKAATAPSPVDLEVLEEIKRELAVVRSQLEELSGREFGFEPAALRAEARRIIELEARAYASTQERIDALGRAPEEKPDEPVEAEVDELPEFDETPLAPSLDAIAGRLGSQPSPRTADLNPLSAIITENARRKEEEAAKAKKTAETGEKPAEKKQATEAHAPAAPKAPAAPEAKTPKKSPVPFPYANDQDAPAGKKEKEQPKGKDKAPADKNKKADKADQPEQTSAKEAAEAPAAPKAPAQKQTPKQDPAPKQKPEPKADATPEAAAAEAAEQDEEYAGGRRRRENTQGISVAELLARAKQQDDEDEEQ
jgi:hypothetical protein